MINFPNFFDFDGLSCPIGDNGAISSYCMLWQEGQLMSHGPMGGLEFSQAVAVPSRDFTHEGCGLRVQRRGTYLIGWRLFVPVGCAVSTRMALKAGEEDLPGAQTTINHRFNDGDAMYSGQTVSSLVKGAALRLASSAPIAYCAQDARDVLASMVVLRLE